ncbi:hypothetical protein GLOIN_2v1653704, partial [Rhizophagus irregularis DAOM 181602=DAOM 197198]
VIKLVLKMKLNYVMNANNHILNTSGVNNVIPNDFNKIFQSGLVKMNLLINLFKKHNLMLKIVMKF